MNPRLQIVAGDQSLAVALQQLLPALGYQVCQHSQDALQAMTDARQQRPDLVLLQMRLPGTIGSGELLRMLHQELDIPVLLLTANGDAPTESEQRLAYGYLHHPIEAAVLHATLRMALSRRAAELESRDQGRRLDLALDSARLGVWEWDKQQDTYFSRGHLDGIDSRPQAHDGTPPILRLLSDSDREQLLAQLARHGQAALVARVTRDDGSRAWVEVNARQYNTPQRPPRLIGVLRDVTERVTMLEQLRQASAVFDSTAEGIAIFDAQRRLQLANPAFLALCGQPLNAILQQDLDRLLHQQPRDDAFYQQLAAPGHGLWQGETVCLRHDGTPFPAWEHLCTVHDDHGRLSHYILACSDISGMRNAQRELDHLACHDALTGLGNRYLLRQQLELEISRSRRHGHSLGLLCIDLDRFKLINDTLGHAAGDRLLQIVAARIQGCIGHENTATRYGGDEFFILCPHAQQADCLRLAQRLQQQLEQPIVLADDSVLISASIGIALFPTHCEDGDGLLRAADSALQQAKEQGKRRYCLFDRSMADRTCQRMQLEQRLRKAASRGQFELHYQPFVALQDGRLLGMEALIRWQDQGRMIEPDDFIPVAEACGLIHDIGLWVLQQACHRAARWQEQHPLRVAVNVSARQFAAPGFVRQVGNTLLESGLYPHLLELEITESTLQFIEESQRVLAELKALGISIAIDDFGTGYSSLALLQHLPLDRLKLDRSFVRGVPQTVRATAICRAVVDLAHSLALGITAEGVTDAAQAAFLRDIGCDTAQGFHYAAPLDEAQLGAYLQRAP